MIEKLEMGKPTSIPAGPSVGEKRESGSSYGCLHEGGGKAGLPS